MNLIHTNSWYMVDTRKSQNGLIESHKHQTTKADESSRSTCFGVRADGSWGALRESRTSL